VTCAVELVPARSESEKIRIHTLNRKTGARVQSVWIDEKTGKPVDEEDEVKGYQRGEDDYIVLEDEELDAVALESNRTIDVDSFVPADSIGWIWYDRPHFLTPADKVGAEAFSVIRDAMKKTKTAAISRIVLYGREHAALVKPNGEGMVLWTLRYGDEVRPAEPYFEGLQRPKLDEDQVEMAVRLIEERTKPWSARMATDPVQSKLREIIESKKKPARRGKAASATRPTAHNVVDIMDALKKSLAESAKRK
jgi:DNA end-binding protein Ku